MSQNQTVTFSLEQINQIIATLGEIPAKYSANLLMFVAEVTKAQVAPAEAAPAPVEVEAAV